MAVAGTDRVAESRRCPTHIFFVKSEVFLLTPGVEKVSRRCPTNALEGRNMGQSAPVPS